MATHYDEAKLFVKEIARSFDLSAEGTRAGIVVYGNTSRVSIKFSDTNRLEDFEETVDNLALLGGDRKMDKALKLAFDGIFKPEHGMRPDAAQVIVLLTDGVQSKDAGAQTLLQAALPLHESKIKVLAVGVGGNVKKEELLRAVKSENDIYIANDFDQLSSGAFVDAVATASCIKGMMLFLM